MQEEVAASEHPKIRLSTRPPIDTVWLDEQLGDLERLVEVGSTLEVVSKLNGMIRVQQRLGADTRERALEDTLH